MFGGENAIKITKVTKKYFETEGERVYFFEPLEAGRRNRMKKIIILFLIYSFSSSLCYAGISFMGLTEDQIKLKLVNTVRQELQGKGYMCLVHSVTLVRILEALDEQACLMGIYKKFDMSAPYHYYVATKRWGNIDIFPEGHLKGPFSTEQFFPKKMYGIPCTDDIFYLSTYEIQKEINDIIDKIKGVGSAGRLGSEVVEIL